MTAPQANAACRVCGADSPFRFRGPVLGRTVAYFDCPGCGYVQTEQPTWLDEAYAEAINRSDTGILRRNRRNAHLVIRVLQAMGRLHGTVIDRAGGYGLLVRQLRDFGVDARWHDPYAHNLLARGFEARDDERADLVTAFEVLEHLVNPIEGIRGLMAHTDALLVSTDLIAEPAPAPAEWWYYGAEHGQHIGFFRHRTLAHVARSVGWHLHSDGRGFHLFTREPLPRWRWQWARQSLRLAPLTARLHLKSRVWTDHAQMRQDS